MLSSWGIAFEPVNVDADSEAAAELKRRGVPLVPAVVVGEQLVHGWNPPALAELVGISYSSEPELSPAELAVRLDRILEAIQRALQTVSTEQLQTSVPGRERTIRDISYHIFRLSLGFRDAAVEDRFPEAWLLEAVPAEMTDGAALADYGGTVREQLAGWFAEHATESFSPLVQTYYGPQSLHALLERTTWHAAQHLRQVYALLEAAGVALARPLTAEDYAGLPLPDTLW